MGENQHYIIKEDLDYILYFQNHSQSQSAFPFSNDSDTDTNNNQIPLNPLSIKEPKKKPLEEEFFDKEEHFDIFIDEKI